MFIQYYTVRFFRPEGRLLLEGAFINLFGCRRGRLLEGGRLLEDLRYGGTGATP